MAERTDQWNGDLDKVHARQDRFENELLDIRDVITELSSGQARTEATLVILSSQMKQLLNRPSRLGAIFTAVGVGVGVFSLALAPVAWLAVTNHGQLEKRTDTIIDTMRWQGYVEAQLEEKGRRNEVLEAQLWNWNQRIEDRISGLENRGMDE